MYPVLFKLGPITITSYGFFVALGFFTGFYLIYKEARKRNFYPDKILDMEACILIFGIIGARLLHVLVNLSYYRVHIFEIFLIWKGGLAIYGGLIFGVIACYVFIAKNKMPLWDTADLIIPYAALGQSIGRAGCFLNGCCFGKPAAGQFLSVSFPGESIYRFPTQIYASLALLGIFVVLKLAERNKPFSGFVFALFAGLYSLQRFFIDFWRGDNPTYIYGLTVSQAISVLFFASAIFILTFRK